MWAILLLVMALGVGGYGLEMWSRSETIFQQILASMFFLMAAVLFAASLLAESIVFARKKIVQQLRLTEAALLRTQAVANRTDAAQRLEAMATTR